MSFGPAAKVYSTKALITESEDMLDRAAPHSLRRGKEGLGLVKMD